MKQVLHLAKKDLTRHWSAALLVLTAIALDALHTRFGWLSVAKPLPEGFTFILVKWPLCFLFAAAVVQEDNTTGARSHWLTRPIQPLALLGAKLLSIFAVVVVPQTVSSGLIALSIDAAPSTVALAAAEVLGVSSALCLGVVFVAALTRSILHACVWVGALALTTAIAMRVLQIYLPELMNPSAAAVAAGGPSRIIAALLFLVPSLAAALCDRFRRRSIPRSVIAGTAIFLGVSIIALRWPWQLISPPVPPAATAPTQEYIPSKISFQQTGQPQTTGYRKAWDAALRTHRTTLPVALPVSVELDRGDRMIGNVSATTTLQFADGTRSTFKPVNSWLFSVRHSALLAATLGVPFQARPTEERVRLLNLFAFAPNENPIPPDRPANATVNISFGESALRLVGRFPLARGTHFQTDIWHEISAITHHPDTGAHIHLRQLTLSSLLQPEPPRSSVRLLGLALYNRKLNEFSIGQFSRASSIGGPGAFRLGRSEYAFHTRSNASEEKANSDLTAEWLADAELLVFRTEEVGRTEQTLHVENLFVADKELPVTRLVD